MQNNNNLRENIDGGFSADILVHPDKTADPNWKFVPSHPRGAFFRPLLNLFRYLPGAIRGLLQSPHLTISVWSLGKVCRGPGVGPLMLGSPGHRPLLVQSPDSSPLGAETYGRVMPNWNFYNDQPL